MSSPRKFSEKIAQIQQKQAEVMQHFVQYFMKLKLLNKYEKTNNNNNK